MILGIGGDLIDIRRIEITLERIGDRFTNRVFTEIERTKSDRRMERAASKAKRLASMTPSGFRTTIDLTIPDNFPLAQAFSVISTWPSRWPELPSTGSA
ncbi:holo-[acyl-carrier protein] synthase [Labrenzia sp. EL_126]|nr:holo-[acyl-carrier protein] synthase [Labrenzia sp. EL_126]